jgi:hypothetical protein
VPFLEREPVTHRRIATARTCLIVAVVVGGALAGCGGARHDQPTSQRTTAKPRQSPTARPTAGPPLPFGQKATLGGTVEATVFAYRQPSVTGGPAAGPSGYTWGSADAQLCTLASAKSTVTVNWKTWSLRYSDNSVVPATDKNDNQFPRPEYPFADYVVPPGQCVRGWITFSVPADKQPTVVQYAPHGFVAEWTVVPSASPTP